MNRVQHLGALEDEPCLADFFRNYREGSGVNARKQLAELERAE